MPTVTPESDHTQALDRFSLPDVAIANMREEYLPLRIVDINDAKGFQQVHKARMVVKSHRIQVEKVRKELKADALSYGRMVDGEAKRIAAMLEPIESHLREEENRHTEEKERIRNEARLKAEAEEQAKAEAEAARLKAIQDAENARLKAEAEKLAEERRKLDDEREKIEAEKQRLEAIEADRQRKLDDERIQEEAAEQSRIETEQRIAREAEAAKIKVKREEAEAVERKAIEAAAKQHAEAMRPDREKILAFAETVRTLNVPELSETVEIHCREIRAIIEGAFRRIVAIVEDL